MNIRNTRTTATLTIRRGVAADAADLAQFGARTFVDTFAVDNRAEDIEQHVAAAFGPGQQAAELVDPDVVTLLAHLEGALVAYAQVRRKAYPACVSADRPVELHRFYVDRAAHGKGIGRALMGAARDAACELGGRHLWLGVWERNGNAIAFYSKMGFVDVGSHAFAVGADRQTDRVLLTALQAQTGA
jgi:GNAT superfamily N-acetyltransferase